MKKIYLMAWVVLLMTGCKEKQAGTEKAEPKVEFLDPIANKLSGSELIQKLLNENTSTKHHPS